MKAEDLFDWSRLSDVKRVNFVVQNRKVNSFNRCVIASITYNFNSFKDKYNGSGSADDEINRLDLNRVDYFRSSRSKNIV